MSEHVVTVRTRSERKAWVDVPASVYRGTPAYVPRLRSEALAAMNPRRNPLHRHARIRHHLLVRDGRAVGRISTTVHPAYIERFGRRVGFFGYLDTVVDEGRYGLLLGAAERVLRDEGMDAIAGPYNYWSGSEFGLLVAGHERPPAAFQTWQPPGARAILEGLGYAARTTTTGFEVTAEGMAKIRSGLLAASSRISQGIGVTTRPLDMRRFSQDAELVRVLFAEAFATSSEVLAYPPDVFASMIGDLRGVIDPELVRFAVRDGDVIGFSFTIPDVNQLLAQLDGRLRLGDLLGLKRRIRSIDEAVVLLVGVKPDAPMGVGHVLFADTMRAVERGGYRAVHTTWVHEENTTMRGLLNGVAGARSTRQWLVMEKRLVS